jgi:hypothetical protein
MCLDATAFLALLPEFSTTGSTSVGSIEWLATGTAGDTISIGGVQLTAVAGARAAGTNTWSVDGDAVAEATSFLAAINDSDATALVEGVKTTPQVVRLTTYTTGQDSELAFSTSAPLVYELSGDTFEGGGDLLDFTLESTCTMFNPGCWGAKLGFGHAYLTAHFLTIAAGGEGGVSAISQGSSATGFDTKDAAFANTKWGRMYLALQQTVLNLGMASSGGYGFRGWGGGCGC